MRSTNPPNRPNKLPDREIARQALWALASWRADDREQWLRVGMALHDVDPDLFAEWDEWSQQSEKYNAKACRTTWRSFKRGGGVSLGTLIFLAKQDVPGWKPGGRHVG